MSDILIIRLHADTNISNYLVLIALHNSPLVSGHSVEGGGGGALREEESRSSSWSGRRGTWRGSWRRKIKMGKVVLIGGGAATNRRRKIKMEM